MNEIAQYLGTGKRKTSVARVILRPGDGQWWVNGRTLEEYFPRASQRMVATAPLASPAWRTASTSASEDARRRARRVRPARSATGSPALVESDPEPAHAAQARGLPHARRADRRAQEGRSPQGPQGAPVLQALNAAAASRRP